MEIKKVSHIPVLTPSNSREMMEGRQRKNGWKRKVEDDEVFKPVLLEFVLGFVPKMSKSLGEM
jgi:hypothetical protein